MDENFIQPELGFVATVVEDYYCYECSTCHIVFQSFDPTLNKCIFCGGSNISKVDKKNYNGCSYLPFTVSLEDAYSLFKQQIRFNFLVPFSLRTRKVKKKIYKAYVPCCLFNLTVEGNISFYGADTVGNVKNSPKQFFESMYSTHFDYFNLLSSNCSRIDDVVMSNINDYDFSGLTAFEPAMVKDSYLIVGDLDNSKITEKVKEKALNRCANIVRANVNHKLKKLADNHLVLGVASATSVMVPVYFMNVRYRGREYLYAVNGQTKKMIIDVPTNSWSIILLSIVCFIIIALICYVVALFL